MFNFAFAVGAFRHLRRCCLTLCLLAGSGVLGSGTLAQSASSIGGEPDLKIAGASAQLGLGGGFFINAWSELRLEAHAPGAYRLELETSEGVRNVRNRIRAVLEVEDAPGVRSSHLRLPLFSASPVHLRLIGPGGERKTVLEPFEPGLILTNSLSNDLTNSLSSGLDGHFEKEQSNRARFEVYGPDLQSDPALWLGANELRLSPNANPVSEALALAWLAAGGWIVAPEGTPGLERVAAGRFGLGSFNFKDGLAKRVNLQRIALALEPQAPSITWPGSRYGFWALGAFMACLIAWRFGQHQVKVVLSSAVIAVALGAVGMIAWTPSVEAQSVKRALIGSGGWGLELSVHDVPTLKSGELRLEPGARPILETFGARIYLADATVVKKPAWSRVRYWLPPKARAVPLRVRNGQIEHQIREPLQDVFVVGFGLQEPMMAGVSRSIKQLETRLPQGLEGLIDLLPTGTVIARTRLAVYVALPEDS
jgi:hypothetical protein